MDKHVLQKILIEQILCMLYAMKLTGLPENKGPGI